MMTSRQAALRLLPAGSASTRLRPVCLLARPRCAQQTPATSVHRRPQAFPSAARTSPVLATARPYSQASQSKIWNFEDIQKLTQDANRNVIIVDTREPSELQQTGRIPGSVNIPVGSAPDSFFVAEDEFEDRFGFARPARDAELVFYCKAGVRSRAAAGLAREAGWVRVGEYPGSWLDWAGRGGSVER